MNKRTKQLVLACLVPVIVLLGMTVKPLYTLFNGEEIILQTVPVDPTDLFRGDYVTLRYEAEEIPVQLVDDKVRKKMQNGTYQLDVYVHLQKKNEVHVPVRVTLDKPDEGVYLKGKLDYIGEAFENKQETAFIRYSLDKYFVEDNTGEELEKASARGDLLAKVKVNNGYAILTDVQQKK